MKELEKRKDTRIGNTTKFFILSGVLAFLWTGYLFFQIQSSKDWIPVDAQLIDLKREYIYHRHGRKTIMFLVKYRYAVNGQSYLGDRLIIPFSRPIVTNENHIELYDKLYASKIIKVFYNPKTPSDAVILNSITNRWILLLYLSIFWNSLIWGFILVKRKRKPRFFLIPLITLGLWFIASSTEIFKIDTSKLINVVEAYPSNDCRFRTPFKEWVYIYVNNERMEGGHQDFNQKSSTNNLEILKKEINQDSIVNTIARVDFSHLGKQYSKKFKLKFQQYNKCDFKFLEINSLE